MRSFALASLLLLAALGGCGAQSGPGVALVPPLLGPETSAGESAPSAVAAEASALPRLLPSPWAAAPRFVGAAPAPAIAAIAAVVVDEASAAVLFDKDGHLPLAPASLTKVAALVLALEQGDLDAWVDVDVDSRVMRGSTVMGLLPGDRFPLRDLLYGLILPSGNDAALAIGRHIAGSDEDFVAQMNELMLRLGLTEGRFANPHGLGGAGHAVSAHDLALLARYGMSLPGFKEIVTAPAWTARGSRAIPMTNINGFLWSYAGADGIKTGFTRRAGSTLAASATRDGHRLFVIVLNSPSRLGDAVALLDWAYAAHSWP